MSFDAWLCVCAENRILLKIIIISIIITTTLGGKGTFFCLSCVYALQEILLCDFYIIKITWWHLGFALGLETFSSKERNGKDMKMKWIDTPIWDSLMINL